MERPKMTLVERIDATLAGQPMAYSALAERLWPDARSHRYQVNGGPPGCYMALSAALRRGGFYIDTRNGHAPAHREVHPRENSALSVSHRTGD